jgi:tRNA dimethylallyltransferase
MQVYRELRILTARPTPRGGAAGAARPLRFRDGSEAYSAGRYAADAARAIADARAQGRVPIVVGGTGLYFKVLLEGLSPVPPIDPAVRTRWRAEAAGAHARASRHPDHARSRDGLPPDADRPAAHRARARGAGQHRPVVGRLAGGARHTGAARGGDGAAAGPARSRTHAQAIEARFDAMLAAGALEEVAGW